MFGNKKSLGKEKNYICSKGTKGTIKNVSVPSQNPTVIRIVEFFEIKNAINWGTESDSCAAFWAPGCSDHIASGGQTFGQGLPKSSIILGASQYCKLLAQTELDNWGISMVYPWYIPHLIRFLMVFFVDVW